MEQDIGFEPMTYTLATCRSSTELILQKENPGADIAHHNERPTSGGLDHITTIYIYAACRPLNLSAA
jgi:hypothetical protein